MSEIDWQTIWVTLKLAAITTIILMFLGTLLAWWLTHTSSRWKKPVSAIVTLPLVLPPTVIGFYLLVFLGPGGPLGQLTMALGWGTLPFTFTGLVIASVIYSLPFSVQPMQAAFEALGKHPLEIAATLGASPLDRFFTVALPVCKGSLITAAVLVFAHTVGEFGVVLMIGGNIPGETKVLSVAIYDHVEALEYSQANILAGGMVIISFIMLILIQWLRRPVSVGLR